MAKQSCMTRNLRRLIVPVVAVSVVATGSLATATAPWPGGIDLLQRLKTPADFQKPAGGGESPFESEPSSPGPDWLLNQRAGERATVSVDDFQRALRQSRAADALTAMEAPEVADAEWELMGPTNIGGRVVDVAIDPNVADTVYAATASGGVWKSTDAGVNWAYSWNAQDHSDPGRPGGSDSDGVLYAGHRRIQPRWWIDHLRRHGHLSLR